MTLARRLLAALAVLVAVAASAGCGGGGDEGGGLRLGYLANITNGAALVGRNEKIFDRTVTAMPVTTEKFATGTEAVAALLAGSLDASYMGMGPVITTLSRAPGTVRVVAGAGEAGATLVVRTGSDIHRIADLEGRRVGFPGYGNTQDLTLQWELGQVGLTGGRVGGDVTTVRIRNADLRTAFERGALDAALAPEPWGSALIHAGLARLLVPADRLLVDGHYPTVVLVVNAEFADRHPDAVRQLVAANEEAVARAAADPDAVAAGFDAVSSSSPPDEVLRAGIAANTFTTAIDREGTRRLVTAAEEAGYMRHPVTLAQLMPRTP